MINKNYTDEITKKISAAYKVANAARSKGYDPEETVNIPLAKNIVIFFNQEITIRFNSTLMPGAVLPISRSPFQSPSRFLDTSNIYLTNTTAATVEIWLW